MRVNNCKTVYLLSCYLSYCIKLSNLKHTEDYVFFDQDTRLSKFSQLGNPLEKTNSFILNTALNPEFLQ